MKTTTWLLVPLALSTTHCLIELSPSGTELHAPTPLPVRDASAPRDAAPNADADAPNASSTDAAPPAIDAATNVDAGSDSATAI